MNSCHHRHTFGPAAPRGIASLWGCPLDGGPDLPVKGKGEVCQSGACLKKEPKPTERVSKDAASQSGPPGHLRILQVCLEPPGGQLVWGTMKEAVYVFGDGDYRLLGEAVEHWINRGGSSMGVLVMAGAGGKAGHCRAVKSAASPS